MRLWSMVRTPGLRTSSPSIIVLFMRYMPLLECSAPPPSYCQAPVIAGMHDTACMLTEPLRERVKP